MTPSDVAASLRSMREAAGLTQAALGKQLGRSQGYVTLLERGERGCDLPEYAAWAAACGVTVELRGAPADPLHPLVRDLVRLRALVGLTQEQIAERIGVARVTLTGWESGNREPSLADLDRWAAAFGQEIVHGFRPKGAP